MKSQSVRILAALSVTALVAGCNTSGGPGFLGGGGNKTKSEPATDATLGTKVVQGSCPNVELREGTAYFRKYAKGGDGDPEKIVFQAAITDATRQCSITGTEMNIKVVAAGRAAAGPAGGSGAVKMPVRVAVVEKGSNKVLYSELTQFETNLPGGDPTAQFLFSDPNVNIPIEQSRAVRIFVGFDEGPPKKG